MDHIRYMRAWLRLNTNTDVACWTAEEVVDSFALLPMPQRTLPEWHALVNGSDEEEEQDSPKVDALERLKMEGSHLFEAGIVRIGA